jgi:serine/threonine protein kinase
LDSRLGLPVNTILDGSYRIARVVGSGGFGITYEAEDINLGTAVAIKEYYPFDFGDRDATMSVKPSPIATSRLSTGAASTFSRKRALWPASSTRAWFE